MTPYELEKYIIRPPWKEELINHFPEEFREELRDPTYPIAPGYNEAIGYFIICAGQGPYIAWQERELQ